ncbi:GATA transcription factor 12-like [Cucurbita pepo subsp. pepo]|uniref:GATA transcription factor 12-like n=1 Tax=Cucurbita pepo subsp. pepo TaxID=3664 RepID=UPI000C9D2E89|nr:GATA transcription factor 12-like [Cucurbita pepo subsp. pepo]
MEAPEYFHKNAYCSQFTSDKDAAASTATASATADHFIVEELLDFSNDDDSAIADSGGFFNNVTCFLNGNSAESSAATAVESSNSSSFSGSERTSFFDDVSGSSLADVRFSDDIFIPYNELVELEWLASFEEEPFSSEDMQKLELITGVKVKPDEPPQSQHPTTAPSAVSAASHGRNAAAAIFKPDIVAVPAKARSKRSRIIPSNWNNSRLLPLSPTSSSSELDIPATEPPPHPVKKVPPKVAATATATAAVKKKESSSSSETGMSAGEGRKCMHCATDKTPQWRTGPMGPKTLCNACGVRYKSGRLVPEYRPAASPTFVLTKHSNSHRKVLELRRQKELQKAQEQQALMMDHHHHHHHQEMMFDSSNGEDYLMKQNVAHDYLHLI